MKDIIIIAFVSTFFSFSMVWADDFSGKWQVTKVDMPETYFGEIKYPKYFEIVKQGGGVSGHYKDQFNFECKFPLATLINGGKELLLMNCGTTKSDQSWAPLHKVKLIKGELVGTVVTQRLEFVWHAIKVKKLPIVTQ